jgi:hypothetical protein
MPVKSHFARWTGDANLLVATSYHADDDIPIAFDLNGERVVLTSAKIPPSTPTLVLVRRESSFDRPSLASVSAEGVAPGIYMEFSYLSNDGEGFPNGAPELEIYANWRLSGDTVGTFNQCSGEDAGNPYRAGPGNKSSAYEYNQDDNTWTGRVRIMDSAQAASSEAADSASLTFWVIEDDDTKCLIKLQNGATANNVYQALFGSSPYDSLPGTPRVWRNRFLYHAPDPLVVELAKSAWKIITGIVADDDDDIVGLMVNPANIGQSYSDANMAIVARNAGSLTVVGRAKLVRYETYVPPPPPPFSVSISGPTSVGPNSYTCGQWIASIQGGESPFQYSWSGVLSSTDYYASGSVLSGGYLYLTVTDAAQVQRNASLYISYDSNNQGSCQ